MKMTSFLPSFTSNGAPVEWNWQGKTDNSEKNLSQCHFVHHKSHMDFFLHGEGPRSWCYGRITVLRLLVQPLWWGWAVFYQVLQVMEHQWNEIDRGKPTTRRKISPSATLSTTNLTWTDPGSNPGLSGERLATNRLSHGTAKKGVCIYNNRGTVSSSDLTLT
jgi:hypothetical protein